MKPQDCKAALSLIVEKLNSVLGPEGFSFGDNYTDSASAGPFSSGFFSSNSVRIGMIYRTYGLGCVIYEVNRESVSHDRLMQLLGQDAKYRLHYDDAKMASVDKDGLDVVEALLHDLQVLVFPALRHSKANFENAVHEAFLKHVKELLGDQYERWLTGR